MNHKLMRDQLPNQPEMWEMLTPKYPPGCKRNVISDDYYPALGRDNVHLETNKIERITPKGIKFEGKLEEEFDLIVTCTGFETLVSTGQLSFKDMVTYPDNSHSSRQSGSLVAMGVLLRRSGQRLHMHTRASQCQVCPTLESCTDQIATSVTIAST
jgi:cation diffusion facilitator CzcD-associated flavoprotein CzcO